MLEAWILNRLFNFVSLFSIVLKLVSKVLGVDVLVEF
jgi:hypothetical protein